MNKHGILPTILLIAFLAIVSPPFADAQDLPHRPKLGLALSGGGAKGLAHLGVIKVMEEAGLKPDYITGVSMGSVVGGLYSLGYSPDSIAAMFRSYDWDAAMSDRIPENKIIFLEKRHFSNSLISLPITRKTIKIPAGLINGQIIEGGLNYYFWPAAHIEDFSQLPVPFLCVATDVLSNKKVIFRGGYLPHAIRASISIPSVFKPVRTDTAVLVDGGVLRNFAVTELREMGAEVVIGSYVSFRGATVKDLESVYGILKQIGFMTSLADYETQKRLTDIMIEPDLKNYSTMSYEDVDSLMARGYREALKYKDRFIRLADSLDAMGPRREVVPLPYVSHYEFTNINVEGNTIVSDEQIKGILDIVPGQPVHRDMLSERIELLYGKGWFEKVSYHIIHLGEELTLEIDCIERPGAMLYGSLHYDPALESGAVVNLSVRDLLTPSSVINVDSYIGQYYRFRISAMQFIDRSQKFGVEASFYADNTRFPLIRLGNDNGPMISQNIITGISLSKRLSLNHLMGLTATFENQHLNPDYMTTGIRKLSYDYLGLTYSYQANTLDYKHFPNRGISYLLSASATDLIRGTIKTDTRRDIFRPGDESSFSFSRFYTARAWFRNYSSPSDKVTLSFGGEILLATSVDSVTSNNNLFYLGGMESVTDHSIPAIGFHANQIPVQSLAGLRFGTDIELAKDIHLTVEGNLFAMQEPDREEGFSLVGGYGAVLAYMSIAGPIRVGIMHGIYDRELLYKPVKGYVSIGFTF
ncbi:MAG: patatin-like phospholipase family protein [Bacteroidales bacterium]